MEASSHSPSLEPILVLGIDTCGPSGSVALGRLTDGQTVEIVGQTGLEGRTYSATLVAAVGELLKRNGVGLGEVTAIVAVNGPGSFTGVRVGLSAVKGLAEGGGIPVAAVSRLAVLAQKAGLSSSALDAHRHELFLRVVDRDMTPKELLAGANELARIASRPALVGICDEEAGALLETAWPGAELVRVAAPNAADALLLAVPLVRAGKWVDVALLDGHYLRRSDAEIFGSSVHAVAPRA
jgi:tRNA threonylcarbamoyladenosine biosynthesis protein TsaB